MKLSLNWLNDYVNLRDLDVAELVERLTLSVCEVEGVEHVFENLDRVYVAEVLKVDKHPGADRLSLCEVRNGEKLHKIVCGAKNVRAGMFVPLAVVGAKVKSRTGDPMEIQPAKIRGVASNGMLCAPAELGLEGIAGEVDGLLDLQTLPGLEQPISGTPLTDALPLKDTILDIDNKSITHRADLWSHFGFAREIAAIYGRKLKYNPLNDRNKKVKIKTNAKLPSKKIEIEKGAAKAYFGRHVAGVEITASPLWMQARLMNVGQRPINNVVDASNYVMLELGQPNHTFDARTLKDSVVLVGTNGKSAKVKKFQTLDGEEREIPDGTILIFDGKDGKRPVALGGIMGGEESGVSDDTGELFLESATFPRELIRPAIAKIGLRTDSAQRFEKGQDPAQAEPALDRLVELLALSCPQLEQGKTTGSAPEKARKNTVNVSLDFLRRRLGFDIDAGLVQDILGRLHFDVTVSGGSAKKKKAAKKKSAKVKSGPGDVKFKITAPTYRSQYDISIPEDIVEEIGRVYGYDNIAPQPPAAVVKPAPRNRERTFTNSLKRTAAAAGGFSETFGYSFAGTADNEAFRPARDTAALPLANPVFADRPELRLSQLPGLLHQAAGNQDRFDDVRLFEVGRIYFKKPADVRKPVLAAENKRASFVHLPAGESDSKDKSLDARPELEALLDFRRWFGDFLSEHCGGGRFVLAESLDQGAPGWLHPGAALAIVNGDGALLGHAGLLHPLASDYYELKRPAIVADLDMEALFAAGEAARHVITYAPPSIFPDSLFEFTVVMDEQQGTHVPVDLIKELALPEIRAVRFLTVFRGGTLPEGKKSASYEVRAARDGGTLTGEELQQLLAKIIEKMEAAGLPLR